MRIAFVAIIALALLLSAGGCGGGEEPTYTGGPSACRDFREVRELAQGTLTTSELNDRLKEILNNSANAEPDIKDAITRAMRTNNIGDMAGHEKAALDTLAACAEAGY